MDIRKRNFAITDLETTGLDPSRHEIIEIGLVVVRQRDFKIIDRLSVKVKPRHIETAIKEALGINGYTREGWRNAISLTRAMEQYSRKTRNAIFVAHNVTFDWSFIGEAFKKTRTRNLMDYHRIDLFSVAWAKLERLKKLKKFRGSELCKFLGIPEEPEPHSAINGAWVAYEILKKLRQI